MKFKVRCKEDISEVFEVYDVCRFRAQNKQGYDIRFLIYDGCFKYVTADVFEPAEESNDSSGMSSISTPTSLEV